MWIILGIIALAGALGGVGNALITDNGFILPRSEKTGGTSVLRPGVFGNVFIGALAACISWGLYGPLATETIIERSSIVVEKRSESTKQEMISLNLFNLVGAVLVGVGGARWLTNEVDKSLLQSAAAKLAGTTPDKDKAIKIALASPAQAAALAEEM